MYNLDSLTFTTDKAQLWVGGAGWCRGVRFDPMRPDFWFFAFFGVFQDQIWEIWLKIDKKKIKNQGAEGRKHSWYEYQENAMQFKIENRGPIWLYFLYKFAKNVRVISWQPLAWSWARQISPF